MIIQEVSQRIVEKHSSYAKYILPHSYQEILRMRTTEELDTLFFQLLSKLNIKSIIECGANEASASIKATKLGINALAIEANPETFHKITPSPNDKFSKLNFGLGERDGSLDFYMPKSNHTAGSATFKPKEGFDYDIQSVPIKRLDSILDKTDYVKFPYALWVDVEGMQKEVSIGASQTLQNKNCKIIKIEVEEKAIFEEQKWLTQDVINHLHRFDYELVFRDFEYASQYNLLFIRSEDTKAFNAKDFNAFTDELKPIGIKDIISNVRSRREFKKEAKAIAIQWLGTRLGNKIAALAGSKTSKRFN